MPRQGFRGNRRVIGAILTSDPGVVAAVDGIAARAAHKAGGEVETRTTDRHVASVVVGAAEQAVDGAATKAINETAGELRGFRSRKEWRAAFAQQRDNAHERAHMSGDYSSLPEDTDE